MFTVGPGVRGVKIVDKVSRGKKKKKEGKQPKLLFLARSLVVESNIRV